MKFIVEDGAVELTSVRGRVIMTWTPLSYLPNFKFSEVTESALVKIPSLVPAFFTVNEDGETYGPAHADLVTALTVLREFPNDTLTVQLVTPACLRYLTEEAYGLDDALRDGMTDDEYRNATEDPQP